MGVPATAPKEPRHPRPSADDPSARFDSLDIRLLELVQTEGRITLSELGRRVNLSPAAVSERIRRLEEGGTITGYAATVSPARLGYGLLAFIRLSPAAGIGFRDPRLREMTARPEVLEAHHLVGEDGWILKVAVRDTAHLEDLLEHVSGIGRTSTSIVLSTPVQGRVLPPAQ
ncbi:Lrp/AsnC family transcriptional regulator [Kitasatospora sp. NBC_01287]|uniref:Lrp/AsnC family transcriptional regulator n=1 Tax=Kitasatospora sp. NBC_01287 TaxID=2903573 RepID=UPI0022536088|nr:Lrp/AsnC family transcriptional regulator [Kitasatospora sp. NBC_01287]MCX4749743.1 Lrp/AsnC family transcriptional regulator [Kitasatospora sp. NBC_01287]